MNMSRAAYLLIALCLIFAPVTATQALRPAKHLKFTNLIPQLARGTVTVTATGGGAQSTTALGSTGTETLISLPSRSSEGFELKITNGNNVLKFFFPNGLLGDDNAVVHMTIHLKKGAQCDPELFYTDYRTGSSPLVSPSYKKLRC